MSNQEFQPELDDELLSAYLDDELSVEERARVEARLANDPDTQQLLDQLRSVSQSVQRLPLETVGRDLRSDILGRIAELNGGTTSHQPQPAQPEPLISIFRTRRSWVWASLALATGLLIMFLQPRDDANKKNLAAAGRRSEDASRVGRELEEIKAPATAQVAETPPATATEQLADQPALIAKDESQQDKSPMTLGLSASPATPAQASEPASAGAPAASSAAPSYGYFARSERPMAPMAAPAPAENASLPTMAARSLDNTNEKTAPATTAPGLDTLATSEPRGGTADNKLAYDRAPADGVAGGPTALGGSFGAMSTPKESPAAASPSAPALVEGSGGKLATGSAAGSAIARAPLATRGALNAPALRSFKGGSLSESETNAEGQEMKVREQLRRNSSQAVVAVVAKPEVNQSQEFERLLRQNGIAVESIQHDKQGQDESVALGDEVKQRAVEEQLSEKADKATADNADKTAFVVEAPQASIDAFVADLRRDSAHFASVNWQEAANGKPRNDDIAELKKLESASAAAANRDQRSDAAENDAASPGQKQTFEFQAAKDAGGKAGLDARAKSSRTRDIGAASDAATQPATGGRSLTDEERRMLASEPYRGSARRVTLSGADAGRLGGSGGMGGGALGPGAFGPGAAPASESREPAAADAVKLKAQSPATESGGNNDNVQVLFVISREDAATPSPPAEKPAE